MFKFNIPNFFSYEIITHRISFHFIFLCFLIFTFVYSFPKISTSNTLPTKYFKNMNENEIENNAHLYLLSTRDGYLHALNKDKEEIWKTYLDQELMSSFTARIINKNLYLYPLNEQIYIIENSKLIRLDIYIKDLVKKQYISVNDFTLIGKIKTITFKIDVETGEIVQKIDEDSNIINPSKKITLRQKNRMRKILTVVRVDYILNCLELIEGEKFWNATYSDILIKKDNDNSDNNFFIGNNFLKKLINGYKKNNIENYEINYDNIITAYAYFNDDNLPNIKIYDRSIKNEEYDEAKRYIDEYNKYKYTLGFDSDNNSKNYFPNGGEAEKNENINNINNNENIIMKYIMINKFLIMIIIFLCSILFYIYHKYIKNSNINNNKINKEQKNEQNILDKKEITQNEIEKKIIIEKEEKIKDEEDNNNNKEINIDKNEKENTNITEESKDFMIEDDKKEDEKEIENIISQINIINEKKKISTHSRDNINKKEKEKITIKNNIWDSDEDEDEGEEELNKEKSKIKNKKQSKSKSVKNKTKLKSNKKNSQSNIQNNIWDDDEEEEEDEKDEYITTKSKKEKGETFENKINEPKKEKEKIKNKLTRLDTDFENLEKIGEGGYGLVLKGTHKIDKYIYAIKIINISDFKNLAQIDEIVNEANKMSMIKDKYIVNYNICWYEDNLGTAEKFYEKSDEDLLNSISSSSLLNNDDITIKSNNSTKLMKQENKMNDFRSIYCTNYRDDSKLVNNSILSMKYKKKFFIILMEYCDGHTLEDLIQNHKKDKTPIDRHLIYTYFRQILKGLRVLHRNGIIHSDIKPGNIFLKKVGEIEQVKIGDFGMAMLKKKGGKLNSKDIKGYTPLYSAPEQMNVKGTYNEKIDIYACGLILYELIGGFTTNAEKYKAFDDLKDFGKIFDEIEKKYKEESELIKLMTKKDYDERPSAEEILVNKVFKELGKIVNK